MLRRPLLGGLLVIGLAILYRFAPDRDQPQWIWIAPGTVVGWLLASAAFCFYTANFGSYGETYGSLGAVVVVMLWLMISATVIVIGAELNAEAEHRGQGRRVTPSSADRSGSAISPTPMTAAVAAPTPPAADRPRTGNSPSRSSRYMGPITRR